MIIESSQDYGQQIITMIWESERPTADEVIEYVEQNYGYVYKDDPSKWFVSIEEPGDFKGLKNPGTATVVIKDPQPAAPEKPEECGDRHDGWYCTKDKGHTDDHEATGPWGNIYATWPNVPKAPVEPEECEECLAMHDDWTCTKDKGHAGPHEAGDGDPNGQIFCIWPNVPKAPTPFDNILIVHECKVPWYNRIGIPMKIWKDVQMHQRHYNSEKIRITIERI